MTARATIDPVRAWVIWLVASVGLLIAEIFSLDLVLIMFSAGALAAAITAGAGLNLLVQALVFAVVSVLALFVARPLVHRRLHPAGDGSRTGIDALKGAPALVLQQVTENGGLVKIGGEEWTARPFDATQILEPGQKVQVIDIKGATAIVWRQP
jgi:membrane protein implicated in regulation of membrane protease activity